MPCPVCKYTKERLCVDGHCGACAEYDDVKEEDKEVK
jgi:hypothetical protein